MLSLSSVLIAGATPGFADNFGINPQGTVATTPTSTPIATLTHPPTETPTVTSAEEGEIMSVITAYFETRYSAFNSLQMDGFKNMIAKSTEGKSFLQAESGKLHVQLKYAELFRLRYEDYEFFLDFKDISIDSSERVATVSVIEGHDVIFEKFKEYNPLDPTVSKMRNLEHTIVLGKEQGEWKIVSDYYEDYLWGFLRATGVSTDELLLYAGSQGSGPGGPGDDPVGETDCDLVNDETTYAYYRDGAVAYAHEFANRPYNDDDYHDFTYDGGDCTNFISQAIYEGGNALMVDGGGTLGWYYNSSTDHSPSWTDVNFMFEFIKGYEVWQAGPEGCHMKNANYVEEGDVIQYDMEGTADWDAWEHGVIIVETIQLSPHIRDHLVASHTPDHLDYPYESFRIDLPAPNMKTRFIHIERLDGSPVPDVDILISQGSDDAGPNPNDCIFRPVDNEVYLGGCDNGGDIISGFRFENIEIPYNSTIESAYLTLTVDGTYTDPIQVIIRGEKMSNPLTFSLTSPPEDRVYLTSAYRTWYISDEWQFGTQRNTPDIKNIIQEIVDQSYWNSGQTISLIFSNDNPDTTIHRRVYGYEREEAQFAAHLVINFTGP
ncbi:MAG: amidase domain-containing protein [Anaerolineales bacterium]|nr:amidase domain-containing protein [Anaerolineales bacterium]